MNALAENWTEPETEAEPIPGDKLTIETAKTEFEFATLLAEKLPPVKTVGDVWHVFDRGAWRPIEPSIFKPQALAILPENWRAVRRAITLLDHIAAAKQTAGGIFKGFYTFDADGAALINATNGVVRVTVNGIELLPHSPDYHFTRQTVARFNPDATAPLFNRVLREVLPDAEDRELFKLCLGNFLFPDCRFETALVCYGEAGRGKSTVADPVASALGLDLVSRLSMSQVCDPRSYHLPALRFAAVNLGTELTTADIAESGNFKTLVSGEPIEARPIYGKPFVMQTASKLWFLANSLPRFKHGTEAELRRTRFLRFDYQPPEKDVTLKARLAGELDGVFLFMLDGLRALLALPEIPLGGRESRAVYERFRISNDPVGAFVQSRCILDPEARVSKDTLREAYAEFTARHELPAACGDWFFRILFERFTSLRESHPRIAGDRVKCVAGLQLRSTVSLDSE
jgi:P4 family phage/plasmid primase-like protien